MRLKLVAAIVRDTGLEKSVRLSLVKTCCREQKPESDPEGSQPNTAHGSNALENSQVLSCQTLTAIGQKAIRILIGCTHICCGCLPVVELLQSETSTTCCGFPRKSCHLYGQNDPAGVNAASQRQRGAVSLSTDIWVSLQKEGAQCRVFHSVCKVSWRVFGHVRPR